MSSTSIIRCWIAGSTVAVVAMAVFLPATQVAIAADPAVPSAAAVATQPADRMAAMQLTDPLLSSPGARSDVPGDDLRLPPNSGEGRRAVYSKTIQRVWIVEATGAVSYTHRVSGLMSQPDPGTYSVFSRSAITCSRHDANICMRYMVRFTKGRRGDNIGFHEIPRYRGEEMQTEAQLGLAISDGCIRQAPTDALVMWEWAQLGTVVVVTP